MIRSLAGVRRRGLAIALALLPATLPVAAQERPASPAPDQANPVPEVVELGDDRYRLGEIFVDRSEGYFTVPGRVLVLDQALEYIAVTVGGSKSYESLLELEADAFEFNLACILIGLSTDGVVPPDFQFDMDEIVGPSVRISAQLQKGGETIIVDVSELLIDSTEREIQDDWVYFGSTYLTMGGSNETYLAAQTGTLISFVHDPASIIDHRSGLGIGLYGSLRGNPELLEHVGMELSLRIALVSEGDKPAPESSAAD